MSETSCKKLKQTGNDLCPFQSKMTPFGEDIEFDYVKAMCLVIDVSRLFKIGRERDINLSASIDYAHLTKSIFHTSSGKKMTDPGKVAS
jgi:hypothetical protein